MIAIIVAFMKAVWKWFFGPRDATIEGDPTTESDDLQDAE